MRRRLLIVLLVPAFACSDAMSSEVPLLVVHTERQIYVTGETVNVIATNLADEKLGYAFCGAQMDLRSGQRWIRNAVAPPMAACLDILSTIEPGKSDTGRFVLRSDIPAGIYRVRTPFHVEGTATYQPKEQVSNMFWVYEREP